jgi:hypothetical protein
VPHPSVCPHLRFVADMGKTTYFYLTGVDRYTGVRLVFSCGFKWLRMFTRTAEGKQIPGMTLATMEVCGTTGVTRLSKNDGEGGPQIGICQRLPIGSLETTLLHAGLSCLPCLECW